MLRDWLVRGTADEHVQRRYLHESTLTYTKARDMALASETAYKIRTYMRLVAKPHQLARRKQRY